MEALSLMPPLPPHLLTPSHPRALYTPNFFLFLPSSSATCNSTFLYLSLFSLFHFLSPLLFTLLFFIMWSVLIYVVGDEIGGGWVVMGMKVVMMVGVV